MQWLILASICIFSCANEVKNATAKGSYGSSPSYDEPSYAPPPPPPSYDQGYGNPPPYGPYMAYQYMPPPPPPLVDRDVCDLDASVLLVVDSRRTHRDRHHPPGFPPMNRANRVRCSVVANYDEDSCNACCQHAARRDKSMPNSAFVGFLAITDDFEDRRSDRRDRDDFDEDMDPLHLRAKRSQPTKVHHLKLRERDFEPLPYFSNVKCVCCAPKRPLPPPPPPPPPPVYQQPAQPIYGQPAASQPYGQPAASQPYGQPAASQPYGQPLASQPIYQQPVASEPTYQQLVASQPIYQQPAASQPTYQQQQPAASPPASAAPQQDYVTTTTQAPPAQAPTNTEYPAPPAAQAPSQPVYQQAAPPAQNPIPNPY